MEKRRLSKKRVWINIAIIVGIVLLVLLILYIVYIAKTQTTKEIPTSELNGRLYASQSGDVQLRFYEQDKIIFKDHEDRRTFQGYEYKDGIFVFKDAAAETTSEYTFLLLTKDRLFYDNGREVLYLIWYE